MTREERRRRSALPPQRLPDGRIRCERGAAVGGPVWCPKPAEWIQSTATIRSPGGVVCTEHKDDPRFRNLRARSLWLPLDNPPTTDPKGSR